MYFISEIVTAETLCMNAAFLICIIIFLSIGFLTFGITSIVFYRKMTVAQSQTHALKKFPTRGLRGIPGTNQYQSSKAGFTRY